MTDVDRAQSRQRLVSYDGDLADEAATSKKAEPKKDAPPAKEKLYETATDQPLSCPADRSTMPGGTSYADYAKKAQQAPACDSLHTENCPVEGTPGSLTVIKHTGSRGFEATFSPPDADVKVGIVRAQVGTQNEVHVGIVSQKTKLGSESGFQGTLTQDGPEAGAHVGIHNADGSTGVNLGLHAQAVSTGIELERADGAMLGVTAAAGVSAGGSIGVREANGGSQICAELDVGVITVHACFPIRP